MKSNGRKNKESIENPIDNLIIKLIDITNPFFYKLGFTPNTFTTFSIIFGFLSAYLLYKENYILCALMYAISYILDCYDGNFARRYNMVTKYGDLYDHIGDFTKTLAIILVFITSKKYNFKCKLFLLLIMSILLFMMLWHLGCQEKIYSKKKKIDLNDSLSIHKKLCINENHIVYSRHFGTGTIALLFTLILLFLNKLNNLFIKL